MDQPLLNNCEKLAQYRDLFLEKMVWESAPNEAAIMAAFLCLVSQQEPNMDRYDECKALLKKTVGVFHAFRNEARPLVLAKISMQEDPKAYLDGALQVYTKFRKRHKFQDSSFMAMASLTLFENGGVEKADAYLDEIDRLYGALKANHPLLISYADYGYLSLLVTCGLKEDDIARKIEDNYEKLKSLTLDKDAVLSLCQILSLPSENQQCAAKKVQDLVAGLSDEKRPISKTYGLPAVGALSLLDLPVEEIVQKISECDDYLSDKSGFRINGGRVRRVFAALLVLATYGKQRNGNVVGNIVGTLTMNIVEEIVMLLVVTCINTSIAVSSSAH